MRSRAKIFHGGEKTFSRGRDAGYPAPPAQIPACGTTAPGSCLGSDAEALIRVRMHDSHTGYPFCDPPFETGPCQGFPFLTTAAQGFDPEHDDLFTEGIECVEISGDSVVMNMPPNNRPEPLALHVDWQAALSPELLPDIFELGPQPLGDGLTAYCKASVAPAFRAVMGEPEEVESFRLPLAPLLTVCSGEAPELDKSGLLLVQFEA